MLTLPLGARLINHELYDFPEVLIGATGYDSGTGACLVRSGAELGAGAKGGVSEGKVRAAIHRLA